MDSTPLNDTILRLQLPFHRMKTSLDRLTKLRELAALSSRSKQGREALSWLKANQNVVAEILTRAKEPYYKWTPYRNRSDGSPSWQSRIIYHTGKQKGCIACGANRIGKTETGAFISAMIITGEHPTYKSPDKGRMFVVGLDAKSIASVVRPKFEMFIPQRFKDGGRYHGKNDMWLLKSGDREWEVWFKTVEAGRAKFQGDKIDFAWIDEEPTRDDVWPELEMRMTDKQAIFMLTATPVEGTKWLKDMLNRPDVYSTMAGMRENPYIPMNEIDRLCRQLTEDERAVRIEGKYVTFSGRPVFDRNVIAEMELQALQAKIGDLAA